MRKLKLKRKKFKGKLIVIEGVEKAGKTTYVNTLGESLLKYYDKENCAYLKMPSSEVINSRLFRIYKYDETGKILYPNSLLLLIMSEMLQITKEVIIPYLKQGKIVICEGYIYFVYCYLLHKKIANDYWFYTLKNEFVKPDIVFYVNVDFKTSIKRILENDDKRVFNTKGYKKFVGRFNKLARKSRFIELIGNDGKSTSEKYIEKTLKDNKVI